MRYDNLVFLAQSRVPPIPLRVEAGFQPISGVVKGLRGPMPS